MAKPEILETTLPNGEIGNVGYISLSEDTKMTVYSDYLINNKVYTLSFYAKNTSTDGTKLEIIDGIRDGIATYLVTQEWNKVKLTFISNGKNVVVYFPSSDYYLYALKLEEGNTATTWTPSENDTKAETLQSARIQYYKSTSATSMVGGEWSTVTPTWESGYYIWTRTMFIHQDGSILYSSPACMTGEKGDRGDNGTNGTSSYTHIKYSVNSNGNPMVDNPTDNTPYIGIYIGASSTAPTNYLDYTWSRYKGTNGKDGSGINSITYYYKTTTTQTAPSASSITETTLPQISSTDKFLWQKEVIDFTDSTVADKTTVTLIAVYGDKGQDGTNGTNGTSVTITSTSITYQGSTSGTTVPSGTWQETVPSIANGRYLWTKTYVLYSDGTNTTSYSVAYKGTNGTNGTDGVSSYTHIRYSTNSSGNPMVTEPTDSTPYIGVYTGTASTAPTSYTDYVWSRYKGQDGTNGTNGTNGNDGISIVSVTPIYYCKSTATKPATSTLPTGNTKVTTDSATTYNAWNLRPATWTTSYKYYFICSQIEYSNGTIGFSSIVQDNSLSKCVTEIIANTTDIGLKVSQGTCIADINASITSGQSSVKILADAINLNGYATINDYFHVDTNGKLHCKDAEITDGTINIKTSTESQSAISLNYQTAQNATMTNEMSSYGNRYQLNLPNNGGWSAGELNNNELILANQQDANNYYGLYATVGSINKSTVNTADFLTLSGTYNGTYNEYYKLKANGEMTATSVKTTSGANLDSVKTKVDGSLKSTLFGNAQGTSSAYPSVDISSIPSNTRIRIEVGVPIDNSGTIGWFAYSTIKSSATTDYLLNIGGYYYSSTYNGSIFVNLSNTRITINNSWTKIIGGTANTTVTNLKSLSRIYVYTENL